VAEEEDVCAAEGGARAEACTSVAWEQVQAELKEQHRHTATVTAQLQSAIAGVCV